MKSEINNENKTNFFCLYFGQEVFTYRADEEGSYRVTFLNIDYLWKQVDHGNVEDYYLTLKPLSSISDEDAITCASLFLRSADDWEDIMSMLQQREKDRIHFDSIKRHLTGQLDDRICVKLKGFVEAEVVIYFDGGIRVYDHKGNDYTELDGIEFFNACDFLRSRGYLLSWMGLSVEEIIEAGWAKYKEQ